jgi:hypothetical protein
LDVHTGRAFRTSPLNVAAERDFNRVDVEGQTPDAIERTLALFEGEAVTAIRRLIESKSFPNDNDWNLILNLLGIIAVRNPKLRGSFNDARKQVLRRIAELLVSDKTVWDHHADKARSAGGDISNEISFEDVMRFVEEKQFQFEFHPQGNLRVEFNAFNELLPLLGKRTWSVLVAPDDGPEFICSDHPVTLVWKNGRAGPVGFGVRQTEVFFPLGRRIGFFGVFEDPLIPVVTCLPGNVATMNRRVALNSERHVYSADQDFFMWH